MYAAVRVRGSVNIIPAIAKTMEMLGLHRANHLVLVQEGQHGMLEKASGYITFGEIDSKVLAGLLEKKGRTKGGKKLDAEFLKEKKLKSWEEAANALIEGKETLAGLGVKTVFRMRPPSKGYERRGIKKDYSVGGALGYRAADINRLVSKMM